MLVANRHWVYPAATSNLSRRSPSSSQACARSESVSCVSANFTFGYLLRLWSCRHSLLFFLVCSCITFLHRGTVPLTLCPTRPRPATLETTPVRVPTRITVTERRQFHKTMVIFILISVLLLIMSNPFDENDDPALSKLVILPPFVFKLRASSTI